MAVARGGVGRLWWWRAVGGGLVVVAYKEVMHLLAWVLRGACKLLRVFSDGLGVISGGLVVDEW